MGECGAANRQRRPRELSSGQPERLDRGARYHLECLASCEQRGCTGARKPATYMQFRIHLTNNKDTAPLLRRLRLTYQAASQPRTVKFTAPDAGAALSGTKDVKWDSSDPDGDELEESLLLSADEGATWKVLSDLAPATTKPGATPAATSTTPAASSATVPAPTGKESTTPTAKTADKTFSWDTKTVPDGRYLLKMVSSNIFAKPADPQSSTSVIAVVVDNTPPTVAVNDIVQGRESIARLEITDALTPITGGAYRLDDNPWIALVPEDGVYGSKHEWVKLIIPAGTITLTPGEHKLTLQAKDAAGNVMVRTITLVIP